MHHSSTHYFSNMKREKILEAILVIVGGFIVLFFIFKMKIFLLASLLVIIGTLMSDFVGEKITWLWFKLAEVLGYINSKILLSVVFYCILFPVSQLYKLFNKNKSKGKDAASFYHERNHTYAPKDFENTW